MLALLDDMSAPPHHEFDESLSVARTSRGTSTPFGSECTAFPENSFVAAGTRLRELGHVVNSWLHGRTECCTGITTFQQCVLICPPLQNFEKMFLNRVLLYSAFSCFVR